MSVRGVILFILSIFSFLFPAFKLGVENISDEHTNELKGKKVGLITNLSGIDQKGNKTLEVLLKKKINVVCLFAPEHGVEGTADSGEEIKDSQDRKSSIPIISLYGKGSGKGLNKETLKNIDVLMFDIQDSGMRHFTYISTLFKSMESAGEKQFIVLDRPNPLGMVMEGPLVEQKLISFISIAPIPLRHGMTVGELADYFNRHELKKPINLKVIKMDGFSRLNKHPELKVPISPGIRSIQSCYGYSFLGLLGEISPFGIGLRTELPFQCVTLPSNNALSKDDWQSLSLKLSKYGISSKNHEYTDTKTSKKFEGLHIHINDINKVNSFAALLEVLTFLKEKTPKISFSKSFDTAIGTPLIQNYFKGIKKKDELKKEINQQLSSFYFKAQSSFLYSPSPVPIFIK